MAKYTFKQIINGDIFRAEPLRRQYPLLFLIVVLVMIYILTGYQAIDQENQILRLRQEVKIARYQYLSVYTEYADVTRQTAIIDRLDEKKSDLHINMRPLIEIK